MEPFTAAATVISVLDVSIRTISALVSYARNTQGASKEQKLLADESAVLLDVLKVLNERAKSTAPGSAWFEERKGLIWEFKKSLDELAAVLHLDPSTGSIKKESRLRTMRTAATWAFTKSDTYAILERISRLQQSSNTLMMHDQSASIDEIYKSQQEDTKRKIKQAIMSWLSPLEMGQVHQTISEKPSEGSGQWFLQSEAFRDWEDGKDMLLWCSGIPGAGKTVMASIVVDHLKRQRSSNGNTNTGVAVAYLKYNDPDLTVSSIMGSFFKQLLSDCEDIPEALVALHDSHEASNSPLPVDLIRDVGSAMVDKFQQLYFVLDGLDEATNEVRWDLIEKLRELEPHVHLLITSRYRDDIAEELDDFKRADIHADPSDIEKFIDHQIKKNRHLTRMVTKSPGIRAEIKHAVVKTAEGMFLLAKLHVESLASAAALSVSHVRKKLQTLPTTLDGTYDAALKRIIAQDEDQKDIAFRTLAWVTYAFRPLSLLELQHALAIDPDEDTLDEDLIIDGPNIAAICAGLIIVDPVTEKVHLVHYTTKMYFERVRDKHFPDFHGMITMSCATYLTMPALRNASLWTIVQRFPLAYYAAQYLGDHARLHPEDALDPPVLHLLYQLLSDENRRRPLISLLDGLDLIRSGFYSSQSKSLGTEDVLNDSTASTLVDVASLAGRVESTGIFEDEAINVSKDSVLEVTALHLAASMGLARVASMLLKETPNIDAVDQTGKTALDVAMERGFEKAVEFLVSNGAAVNLHETKGRAALLLAAERDWRSVTERLAVKALAAQSEHDANISLLTAVCRGFLEDTKHLIQEIFSRRTTDTDILGTALFVAVESNQEDIVKALLNGGVDVNSTDNIGQTSMHRATRRGNVALVDILLKHGADINIKNDDGFSPWAANMRPENFKILKHLVDAGADPNTKAQLGISVLYSAAAAGQADTVKFMLRCGTDPSIKTDFDWAPIHWAAYHGFEDCVRILVEAGADVNAVSSQNKAPLDLAIEGNQASIIELLRSHGAKTYEDLTKDPTHDLSRDVNSLRLPDVKPKDFAYLIFDVLYNQSTLLGQYVYAVEHPLGNDFAPYHLSHALDDRQPMEVRRASGRMPTSDDTIFTIVPLSQDFQEMEIQPSGAYASQSPISLRRGWNGSWKVHQEVGGTTVPLFRTRPDWAQPNPSGSCWITDDGEVLARTRGRLECVFLSEKQMENQLFNNLVVCWIARVWYETLYAA